MRQKNDIRAATTNDAGDRQTDSKTDPLLSTRISAPIASLPVNYDRQMLLAIIESSADCIIVWDKNYNYIYVNQSAIDHVGTTADKVIGKTIREGLGHLPEFMNLWMRRIDTVFATGKRMHVADAMTINGRLVYSESTVSPVLDINGQIIAVSVVYRDVTERKLMEKKLIDDEQKFRYLYQTAQIPMYRTRLEDGKLLECNLALAKMLGYASIEECLALCRSADHYVDLERRAELIRRLKEQKDVYGFEVQIRRRNGRLAWVEITAHLNQDAGFIEGLQFDITPAKVLTAVEKQILKLILDGKSNKEISAELNRSVRTIEDHRYHMMRKLGVDNIVDLLQMSRTACLKSEF